MSGLVWVAIWLAVGVGATWLMWLLTKDIKND